ncbi:MAG: hypothetical protein RLZZ383_2155 [Pseudomonadota bacterium]
MIGVTRRAVVAVAVSLGGTACGDAPVCPADVGTVTPTSSLACAATRPAVAFAEQLAARPLTAAQARSLRLALAAWSEADPSAVEAELAAAAAVHHRLGTLRGPEAAAARMAAVDDLVHGDRGPFGGDLGASVRAPIADALAIWASSGGLHLTEMDVEGWIRLASLCREVQGGTPLKLSIADRVSAYRAVVSSFEDADSATREAMLSVGPMWPAIKLRWQEGGYDVQQGWVASAPLPGPMEGVSLDYLGAVLALDRAALVRSVHQALGPLPLGVVGASP